MEDHGLGWALHPSFVPPLCSYTLQDLATWMKELSKGLAWVLSLGYLHINWHLREVQLRFPSQHPKFYELYGLLPVDNTRGTRPAPVALWGQLWGQPRLRAKD